MPNGDDQPPIRVTEISQFVKQNSCERWLRLAYNQRQAAEEVPFYERLFNPLDPVLQQRGKEREDDWASSLRNDGVHELTPPSGEALPTADESGPLARNVEHGEEGSETDDQDSDDEDDDYLTWDEFRASIYGLARDQEGFAREVRIRGEVGAFPIKGRMDFLVVRWGEDGAKLRVVETKNSRKDRTSQRIQVALYEELLEDKLESSPLRIRNGVITEDDIECVVGRIDDTTNQIEDILELDTLDLSRERSDVRRLLEPDGRIEDILSVDAENIDELDYRLEPKCDQCVFDVYCYPESAKNRRLELLGVPPSTVRAMEDAGVEDIDDLATLDLDSDEADEIRNNQSVREDLSALVTKAQTRVQNLPDTPDQETADVDAYDVQPLENRDQSQLPTHEQDGDQLIRVYLNVDYDYVEDRVVALAAHITNSEWNLQTRFEEVGDNDFRPDPNPVEMPPLNYEGEVQDGIDAEEDDTREIRGESVIEPRTRSWSGHYERDTETESQLIERFLQDLIDEIIEISPTDDAYVHFYVWSQSEIEHLVDACSRGGTRLLNHLRQLLGCREPTEQLIYSSLQEEIDNRYALAWAGQGLTVASGLTWFGDIYHWTRDVAGHERDLENVFEQDVFDYKSTLGLNDDGSWAEDRASADQVGRFEIRSRFFDSMPLGYLHEIWGEIPNTEDLDADNKTKSVIDRYKRADRRDLKAYLTARTHALRWFDEHIRPKDDEITKTQVHLPDLDQYDLNVHHTARAALDFLLLDQSVAMSQWYSDNMQGLSHRVPQGLAIPLRNVRFSDTDDGLLIADLDFDDFGIGVEQFRRRTGFEPGDLVRISPYSGNPEDGPTFGQLQDGSHACSIERYDWENEEIQLSTAPWPENRYRLGSSPFGEPGEHLYDDNPDMVLTESVSDHPAGHVDQRLRTGFGGHMYNWFDPTGPDIPATEPISEGDEEAYEALFEDHVEFGDGDTLMDSQVDAVLEGLNTRVHLIHGPPGTGKTTTTAMAVLLRILDRREEGERMVVTGATHQAVNTLLSRIQEYSELFREAAGELGFDLPSIDIVKVASSDPDPSNAPDGDIDVFGAESNYRRWNQRNDGNVLIIGGTVSAVLKDFSDIDDLGSVSPPYQVPELIVDEASMMVFPHFLALSTVVEDDGYILLSGDHRQLSPIVAHEWEDEDRPPIELYQPYASAFEAVRDLERDEDIRSLELDSSPLQHTFRLPPAIRALIRSLYQSMDELELHGEVAQGFETPDTDYDNPLEAVWESDVGLFLVAHDERESRLSNNFEATLTRRIIESGRDVPDDSVAVLTPHTAQRSNLELELEDLVDGPISIIDTVERLQGAEAESILVSATASDPTAIGSNEEFLLDLNRSNVAFSRSQRRLIVVVSKTFLDHIPPEIEEYNSAMLWKSLRNICTESVGEDVVEGHDVEVFIPDPDSEELQEVIEDNSED